MCSHNFTLFVSCKIVPQSDIKKQQKTKRKKAPQLCNKINLKCFPNYSNTDEKFSCNLKKKQFCKIKIIVFKLF